MNSTEVVAIFDIEEDALKRLRSYSGKVYFFNDYDKFLQADITIVIISTPDSTHAEYMAKAINAGKHVLCEKPLTDSLKGIKQILKALNKSKGCVAAVQHQMRFLPVHLKMKEAIEKDELGKISYIEGYYVHNLTKRGFLYHNWRKTDNATPLIYSGIHMVDLLRWLVDDEVVEISGMSNNISFPEYPESDLNVILLKFKSGIIGKVITAFGAARPQDHSVRIYGTKKSIENNMLITADGKFNILHRPFFQLKTVQHNSLRKKLGKIKRYWKPILLSYWFEFIMKISPKSGDYALNSYPLRVYEHSFAVRESILDFLSSIEDNRTPKCTVLESAKSAAISIAGVEAYRTGKTIKVKDFWLKELD